MMEVVVWREGDEEWKEKAVMRRCPSDSDW
jgi:hypothetical protein